MRTTLKLFATAGAASARQAERYLTPGNPTGLTGLRTHPCPRSALIYTYESTLKKLAALPASSAYREATRALTQHRLDIVRGVEPAGYGPWSERARQVLERNRDAFGTEVFAYGQHAPEAFEARRHARVGFARWTGPEDRVLEWDGEGPAEDHIEGLRTEEELEGLQRKEERMEKARMFEGAGVEWEDSPALDASQIEELEDKLGSGLIEEVITIAQGESKLVDEIAQSKAWEELVDRPAPDQWQYFSRQMHMNPDQGQAPPDAKK